MGASELVGTLAASVCFLALAWSSYLLVARLAPRARPGLRTLFSWLIASALLLVVFASLAAAAAFSTMPALVTCTLLSTACHAAWGKGGTALACRDVRALRGKWRRVGPWRLAVIAVCAPAALRLARSAVSPPLAWDALTYHLPRAVEWVQNGRFVPLPGPDSSAYYNFFPPYGEVFFAWAMVFTRSDVLLGVAGAWAWVGVWLGAYGLARAVGASRHPALASAAAAASTPAVASFVSASYVDNFALAALLAAVTFSARMLTAWRPADAAAAGLAFGMLVGTKSGSVVVVGAVGVWAAVAALCSRQGATGRALFTASASVALASAPPIGRALAETGNPLYPLTVSLGSLTLWHGDQQLAGLMRFGSVRVNSVLESLFAAMPAAVGQDHLGFGPGAIGLLVLAALGARQRRRHVARTALLIATAAAIVFPTFAADARGLWANWPTVSPRLIAGALGVVAAMAARSGMTHWIWLVAIFAAFLSWPQGLGPREWHALRSAWPVAVIGATGAVGVSLLFRSTYLLAAAALATSTLVASLAVIIPVRDTARAPIYEEAARGVAFDLHTLGSAEVGAWPLWRQLERKPSTRIGLAAGFWAAGHNWYRYPLYGARLQHLVVYVPVAADGGLLSYSDPAFAARACIGCWIERLHRRGVALVVGLAPLPPEVAWARAHPEMFTMRSNTGTAAVFDVKYSRGPTTQACEVGGC